MTDIHHYYGGDLGVSPTGDLQPVTGALRTQQRILRRLLTNPGEYIWHPDYGAGLPKYVGSTVNEAFLIGLIRGQILKESAVAPMPEPQVTAKTIPGGITVVIHYYDQDDQSQQVLSFNVNE